jgi:hypothetical protein
MKFPSLLSTNLKSFSGIYHFALSQENPPSTRRWIEYSVKIRNKNGVTNIGGGLKRVIILPTIVVQLALLIIVVRSLYKGFQLCQHSRKNWLEILFQFAVGIVAYTFL